jgi:predicted transcriptional regulator
MMEKSRRETGKKRIARRHRRQRKSRERVIQKTGKRITKEVEYPNLSYQTCLIFRVADSVCGTGWTVQSSIPAEAKFNLSSNFQIGCRAQPAAYLMGTGVLSGDKVARHEIDLQCRG